MEKTNTTNSEVEETFTFSNEVAEEEESFSFGEASDDDAPGENAEFFKEMQALELRYSDKSAHLPTFSFNSAEVAEALKSFTEPAQSAESADAHIKVELTEKLLSEKNDDEIVQEAKARGFVNPKETYSVKKLRERLAERIVNGEERAAFVKKSGLTHPSVAMVERIVAMEQASLDLDKKKKK